MRRRYCRRVLSDTQTQHALRWRGLHIGGYNTAQQEPSSYDVRLHPKLLVLRDGTPLDPRQDTTGEWDEVAIDPDYGYILRPGQFVLGSTLEYFAMGDQLVGTLHGKSSLGRLGLLVHVTAGYIDTGFCGQITLEMQCIQRRGIVLYPGMRIGQVSFDDCVAVKDTYAGKYVGQEGPTASQYHLNWIPQQRRWK